MDFLGKHPLKFLSKSRNTRKFRRFASSPACTAGSRPTATGTKLYNTLTFATGPCPSDWSIACLKNQLSSFIWEKVSLKFSDPWEMDGNCMPENQLQFVYTIQSTLGYPQPIAIICSISSSPPQIQKHWGAVAFPSSSGNASPKAI